MKVSTRSRYGTRIQLELARHPAAPHSYICTECQADDTIDDVRSEIKALRNHLLHRQEE